MLDILKQLIDGFFSIFNLVFWYEINLTDTFTAPIGMLFVAVISLLLIFKFVLHAIGII